MSAVALRAGMAATIDVGMYRWGGGARPGKWHVFVLGLARYVDLSETSFECVTDDFGNLVRVPS